MRFCFMLCRDLGIDDPETWMNAVPPKVVDQWMAFYSVENSGDAPNMESPSRVFQRMSERYG